MLREKYDQIFKQIEEKLQQLRENQHVEIDNCASQRILKFQNRNQKHSHQNTLKAKWLLSPLKLHPLKITLITNFNPILVHLIKVLINNKKNWSSSRYNNTWNKTSSHRGKWGWIYYYHLWNFIFWRLLRSQSPIQVLLIWSKFQTRRKIIFGFQSKTLSKSKQIKNNWSLSAHKHCGSKKLLKISVKYQ